ncbi:MAG: hypothetical protein U0939_26275 [Pirellulales bacterium]
MTLDHYSLCPCGSGKKVKFCCSNDILPELEKVFRAIEGDQRNSAIDQINKLMDFKGKRMSLLALKAELQLAKEDEQGATQTTNEFLQKDPSNPLALSLATLAAAQRLDVVAAVQKLNRALETSIERKVLHETLFQAIEGVASVMLGTGDVLGARAYFLLESLLQSEQGQLTPSNGLASIDRNPNLIPLLKQEFESRDCPTTVVWREAFEAARLLFNQGFWWKACEAFEQLNSQFPGQSSILYNLALLRSRLGNMPLAASAWRAFAQAANVPLEDAVEALATARVLESKNEETVDLVKIEIPLSETDRVMERLLSNPRCVPAPGAAEDWDNEDGPPPKAVFLFLDRPKLTSAANLSLDTLPRSLGLAFLFGRQTDRQARIEFSTSVAAPAPVVAELREVCGESAGAASAPETINKVSALTELLESKFVPPPDASPDALEAVARESRRQAIMEQWISRPWKSLDGKRPRDIAADPAYRNRLLADILVLEQRHANDEYGVDFNELRAKLGLPTLEPIDGKDVDLVHLSLVRLGRVKIDSLSDEQLTALLERTNYFALSTIKNKAAEAVLQRPALRDSAVHLLALSALAQTARSIPEAMNHYREAAKLSEKLGRSPAPYLIGELQIAIPTGDSRRAMELVQILQTKHMSEKGIPEYLFRTLRPYMQQMPDGRTLLRLPSREAAATAGAGGASGGLWTPDQGSPAAPIAAAPAAAPPPAAGKSKLWIPGMD